MSTLGAVLWQVTIVKAENELLRFESEPLIQHHGRVGSRHVQGYVFAQTRLDQVVQHVRTDSGAAPLRVHEDERDVRFVELHIRHHEGEADHEFSVSVDENETVVSAVSFLL